MEGVQFLPGTNSGLRASTGVEFQILVPIVNAPFRLIFAHNPRTLDRTFTGPSGGAPFSIRESRNEIKFSIGKTS